VRSATPAPDDAAAPARTWPAALTLFLGAALVPETIATFNSPPARLLTSPYLYLFLSAFYGSVALLVREFLRRRPARWSAVLLLGMAAGAVNEGIIAGTWYKVQYRGYALIGGFDPAVATGLTVFHALVSTLLPIALANILFPKVASKRWLGRPAITGCLVLLALTTAAGFAGAAHRPQKAIVLVIVLAVVAVALALPGAGSRPAAQLPVPSPGRLRLAGAAATVGYFVLFAVVPGAVASTVRPPDLGRWQVLLIAAMLVYFGFVVAAGRSWFARDGWGEQQTLAIITGALLPPIVASLVLPPALAELEPLATVPMLAMLVWLSRRLRRADQLTAFR
jgi:hypothetical protein